MTSAIWYYRNDHGEHGPFEAGQLKELVTAGTIQPDTVDRLENVIREKLGDRRQLALWFGQHSTAPKSMDIVVPAEEPASAEGIAKAIHAGEQMRWNEGSRFAYYDFASETALFVDGEQFLLKGDARLLAPLLCAAARIDMAALVRFAKDEALLGLLTTLYNQGSVYFE